MDNGELRGSVREVIADIQNHRSLYIFESIVFILLGLLAIAVPGLFTLATELFIGWLLVFAGVVQAYRAFQNRASKDFWPSLISAIIFLIVGLLLLFYPLRGVLTLTMLLSFLFVFQGIAQMFYGFQLKPLKQWGWFLFGGLVNLAMAAIIWYGWPSTAFWVIGLLVGINLLMFGFSLLFTVLSLKNLDRSV